MDERELSTRMKALSKAVASNEPAESILGLLGTLRNAAAPSEEVLRTTKAGHVVGKLRMHANSEIKRHAAEIVSKWKKSVELEKHKRTKKMSSPASTPGATASPVPANGAANVKWSGDPEKRKFQTDNVDISRTGTPSRDNCVGLMYNGLAFRSTEQPDVILSRAIEVEAAAFAAYNGETQPYKDKLRSLFQNMKQKNNPALARRVMSGEIPADKFVIMSREEMKSAQLKRLEEDLAKDNMKRAQVPMAEKSISTAIQCGKCKQKQTSYTQAQTRSADEPMTTFCECLVCGNRWKFS